MTAGQHWSQHAKQWDLIGPPLRPSPEDTACMQAIVDGWGLPPAGSAAGWQRGVIDTRAQAPARPLRALVLGVTPELVRLRWPAGSRITAIDRSAAMIAAMGAGDALALQADWRALPCAAASAELALGDGSLNNLTFPHDYGVVARELARVLVPGGEVALRLFASPPPAQREALADVAAALAAHAIGSFHAFKWRLAMAVAGDGDIAVADIARAFDRVAPDPAAFAAHTGWPPAVIATIDNYRASELVYSFPSLAGAVAALAPHLALCAVHTPTYELGERCPTIVLRCA